MIKTMKKISNVMFVVLSITAAYLLVAHFDWIMVPPFASAATAGTVTTKPCPANTDKGVYFQRGTDPTTGDAICGFSYYNACPYSEAVSADDPMCQKAAPKQTTTSDNSTPAPVSTPVTTAPQQQPVYTCGGK